MHEPIGPKSRANLWVAAPVLIFAGVAFLFALSLQGRDPSKLPSVLVGKPAPSSDFPALEGFAEKGRPIPGFNSTDLAKGRWSIVNFWASWCAPCVAEHAVLNDVKKLAVVDVYGVSYKDTAEAARRFLGRYGNPYAAIGTDASGRNGIDWGVYGTPETFLVNGKGEIVLRHVGELTEDSIKNELLPAMKAAQR